MDIYKEFVSNGWISRVQCSISEDSEHQRELLKHRGRRISIENLIQNTMFETFFLTFGATR